MDDQRVQCSVLKSDGAERADIERSVLSGTAGTYRACLSTGTSASWYLQRSAVLLLHTAPCRSTQRQPSPPTSPGWVMSSSDALVADGSLPHHAASALSATVSRMVYIIFVWFGLA